MSAGTAEVPDQQGGSAKELCPHPIRGEMLLWGQSVWLADNVHALAGNPRTGTGGPCHQRIDGPAGCVSRLDARLRRL